MTGFVQYDGFEFNPWIKKQQEMLLALVLYYITAVLVLFLSGLPIIVIHTRKLQPSWIT